MVEKQEEIEILQEKVMSLNLQLMKREEKISQLMENTKGKQLLHILLYKIIYLALQSQVIKFHGPKMPELLCDQIQGNDHQLGQMFEKVLASQKEQTSDGIITQESDDRVDGSSKITSSDHETEDITSQSKI